MIIKFWIIVGMIMSQVAWAENLTTPQSKTPAMPVAKQDLPSMHKNINSTISETRIVELNVKDIMYGNLPEGAIWARVFYELTDKSLGGVTVVEIAFKDGTTKLYINTEGIASDGTGNFEVQDITGHEDGK